MSSVAQQQEMLSVATDAEHVSHSSCRYQGVFAADGGKWEACYTELAEQYS